MFKHLPLVFGCFNEPQLSALRYVAFDNHIRHSCICGRHIELSRDTSKTIDECVEMHDRTGRASDCLRNWITIVKDRPLNTAMFGLINLFEVATRYSSRCSPTDACNARYPGRLLYSACSMREHGTGSVLDEQFCENRALTGTRHNSVACDLGKMRSRFSCC